MLVHSLRSDMPLKWDMEGYLVKYNEILLLFCTVYCVFPPTITIHYCCTVEAYLFP